MKNPVEEKFSEFYEKWVWKLEEILHQLLEVSKQRRSEVVDLNEQEVQALVSKVTAHLKEYYTVKWASAHEDVLVFFSPVWLTPLENASLWVTGWKPSTAFECLKRPNKALEMTEEQGRKTEGLRMRIRMEEEKVEREMERQQVAMADRKMVELAKISSRARNNNNNGEVVVARAAQVEVALKAVSAGLEKVMKASDCVRLKTLKGILDLLTPIQCVEFLAAFIAMQLRLRQWGKKRDITVNEEKV